MTDLVLFRPSPSRRLVVRVEHRRDRRRLASVAAGMRAAGWPDHAICRCLRIPRGRLPRLVAFAGGGLADLRALIAAVEMEGVAA